MTGPDSAVPSRDDEPRTPSCVLCGRCLTACPSYRANGVETFSPRGRGELIRAVLQDEMEAGPRYRESLSSCLQCLSCSETCPRGVDVAGLVRRARAELVEGSRQNTCGAAAPGAALGERLALQLVLADRNRFAALVRICRALLAPFSRRNETREPGGRHLPHFLPRLLAGRRIPDLARLPLHRLLPETVPAAPDAPDRGRVLFFSGCFMGTVNPTPALAAVTVLTANGYTVVIPRTQTCCGTPARLAGHDRLAVSFARRNIPALAEEVPIVTPCATCASMLRHEYPELPGLGRAGSELASRVHEACAFLAPLAARHELGTHPVDPCTVTIHDPCHLARGLSDRSGTRTLLECVPGVTLREMEEPASCCGGGGLSGFKHPDVSGYAGTLKASRIAATGAELTAAACPGCIMQLNDHLSRIKAPSRAVHPLEIAARMYAPVPSDTAAARNLETENAHAG